MAKSKKLRILILAEHCNPEWPSLPVVAYKAIRAIAEYADVTVATHLRNQQNIQKVGLGSAKVRYFDTEYLARPMHRLATMLRGGAQTGWTTAVALDYPSYIVFEWAVWRVFREELQRSEFDVVHRISPMSPTLPSPIAKWSPVPFVLGPINGGLKWPQQFREELVREREWLSYIRSAYRLLPYHISTYRRSKAVLAAFQHTIDDLSKETQQKTINFPEIGIDPQIFNEAARHAAGKKKNILFVGRLVPYKCPRLVVQAFAELPDLRQHRLTIVGEGPERGPIERLIETHNLQHEVRLLGWKSQNEVAALMREADIFAFPSIRELGAGALLEAMACGLACVVVDYGGPGALVSEERGIKVPLTDKSTLTQNFGEAMLRLAADSTSIGRLGAKAREHANSFYTWSAKARKTVEVYQWVLDKGPRPDFWDGAMPAEPQSIAGH